MQDVHHVHLWRMQEHATALDAHVVLDGRVTAEQVKMDVKRLLSSKFDIDHCVLELESAQAACSDAPVIGH